jgi:uncharacterized membrane protein (DUF373 family)
MITERKIKAHYDFTSEEERILGDLSSLMREYRDRFAMEFYEYVMSHDDMAVFFQDTQKLEKHKMLIAAWFMRLFNGVYNEAYFRDLHRIGKVHVDINLDGHFVNSAMTKVRNYVTDIIVANIDAEHQEENLLAANKILDINLDILTTSYRRAEMKKYFIHAKAETALVSWMERFTHGLNLVLGIALAIVSLEVIALFIMDAVSLVTAANFEQSVVAALGSLLIIWMMIELLGTEVQHLKGRKIPIKIFIGIVLVAFIRKVLIGSLESSTLQEYGTKVGTLFLLAIVYWLVAKADRE